MNLPNNLLCYVLCMFDLDKKLNEKKPIYF